MTIGFIIFLVILAVAFERLSLKDPFRGLKYDFSLSRSVVECGEEFEMTSIVSNSRRRPVFFLQLEESIPASLEMHNDNVPEREIFNDIYSDIVRAKISQTMYIMPRQKVKRTITVSLPTRGRYLFSNGRMKVGDLLGLSDSTTDLLYFSEVVVLPERVVCPEVLDAFGNYLGDISVRRFILSDPILTAGFREYSGREPQRDISWPASLRQGKLMVKQYDYTSEQTAAVLLNIAGGSEEDIERSFSLTRVVCEALEDKRVSYSFLTNANAASTAGSWYFMGSGLGSAHLDAIVEGLGRATREWNCDFETLLEKIRLDSEQNKGFILVTVPLGEKEKNALSIFENRLGVKVFLAEAREEKAGEAA